MKKISKHIPTLITSIILFAGVPALYAWTGPTSIPPTGNVSAPINIGTTSQNKLGALGLGGLAVFGKSLLTETNDYILPTSKPNMLLGVNGAVGAKEYCDEKGQNCVTTLGGVSSGGGVGWEDVPLNNNDDFSESCMYRFRMDGSGYLYPSAVYSKVLYWNISEEGTQIHYILSTDKISQRYKVVSNFGQVQISGGGTYITTVSKIEKFCGGSSQSSSGSIENSGTQIFSGWPNALVCNSLTGKKQVLRVTGYYPKGWQRYSDKPGYIYGEIGNIMSIYFDASTKKSLIVHGNGDLGANLPQEFSPCFELGKSISDPVFTWSN